MWWNKHFNKWIDICIEDPLKTWKRVKTYFKKPKLFLHFFTNPIYCCPYASLNSIAKILDIRSFDVGWKDKYDTPRHERNPYIWVCFFKRFGFNIIWHISYKDEFGNPQDGDMYYWEYLLNYLYYEKTLKGYSTWIQTSKLYKVVEDYGEEDDTYKALEIPIPVVSMSLTKEGINKLKKELND